ncbi:sensor histidine kinase [Paenibacillus sp. OV219]|uniref:cache domain-containing sensor histidine kinase n=1 Tax=Paenibacillus sp. OV219 TaxID=1884377 RepID=UPI0008D406A1|nr:sensor histidine kinase [Paenibacillus sp. OV219]SEO89987.1 two-component system, sensor histidine kinase YesM [Paenibacillus sp. OV219]
MYVWNKLIQWSRRSKVQTRLIVTFLILSIIPLGIIGVLSYNKSAQSIHEKTSIYSTEILTLLNNKINNEIQKYETFADQIMMNARIQNGLRDFDQMNDLDRSTLQNYIEESVLKENVWILPVIRSMQIQMKDGRLLYDYGYGRLTDKDFNRLMTRAKKSSLIDTWSYGRTTSGEPCLTLIRRIPALDGKDNTLGYLILGIDESLFAQTTYSTANLGTGSELLIINGTGEMLSSKTDMFHVGETLKEENPLKVMLGIQQVQKNVKLNEENYFVSAIHDDSLDWYLVGLIPYTYLNAQSYDIAYTIVAAIVLCIIFTFVLAALISSSIASPLRNLNAATAKVMGGNLKVLIRDEGQDEIGFLALKFNQMMQRIYKLIEEVKEEQARKRDAELSMLQAQINPHFLFNTLNSLKWAAVMSQATSVGDGLGALAELLRSTIVNKDEQVTLRDELRNISNYVVIQQVRYGTSLQTEYDIEEKLMDAHILKFLLQPIVENAIIHGFEGVDREPRITISAKLMDTNSLQIMISDNGKGMGPVKIQQLLSSNVHDSKKRLASIGMGNVKERINIHFGQQYGLDIRSEPNCGTDIVITIPYITRSKEEKAV